MQRRLHLNELVLKHSSNLNSINKVNILDESIFAYTCSEEDELRSLIRSKMHSSYQNPATTNIVFTSGSCMALEIIISWFRHQKNISKAICYNKTFTMAIDSIHRHNYEVELINIGLDFDKELELCWDEKISQQSQTCLVYIPNPNNPTCHIIPNDKLYSLVKKYPQHIFLIDEAYQLNSITIDYEILPNMIITQTLSKVYGAAGLRVGWVIGTIEILPHFDKGLFSVGPTNFKLGKAIYESTHISEIKQYLSNSIQLIKEFSEKYNVPIYFEESCLFFLIHGGRYPSKVVDKLREENILVKNLSRDYKMWGWLRSSFDEREVLEKIFKVVSETMIECPNYYSGWFPESHFTKLRSVFKKLISVLNKNKVEWWLTDGNLLGMRRGKCLLKWDDDIDIAIRKVNEDQFCGVFKELSEVGIRVRKNRFGVYWQIDEPSDFEGKLEPVHIDCFLFHTVEGKLQNTDERFVSNSVDKKEFNLTYDEPTFKLVKEEFLGEEVYVPSDWKSITDVAVNHKKWIDVSGTVYNQLLFEPIVDDYKSMFTSVAQEAINYLKDKFGGSIVIDFDNTLFANARWWKINRELFDGEMLKNYDNWVENDIGPLNPLMQELIDICGKNSIEIIVLTARGEHLISTTEKNMKMFEFRPTQIIYKFDKSECTCEYKARNLIELIWHRKVHCTIGDQPSDHLFSQVKGFLLPRTNLSECVHKDIKENEEVLH